MADEGNDVKEYIRQVMAEEKAKQGDKVDAAAGGVAGAAIGGVAGWGLGTLATIGAAAVGIAAAPVIVPLAVAGGITYGALKGGKKLWE